MDVMLVAPAVITALFFVINYIDMKYIKKTELSKDVIKNTVIVTVSSVAGIFAVNKLKFFKSKAKPEKTQVFVDKPEF